MLSRADSAAPAGEETTGVGSAQEIFRRLADGEVVIMDGGTGTQLQAAGAAMDDDAWSGRANLDRPELVQAVHEAYLRAGADVLIANTFAASRAARRGGRLDVVVLPHRHARPWRGERSRGPGDGGGRPLPEPGRLPRAGGTPRGRRSRHHRARADGVRGLRQGGDRGRQPDRAARLARHLPHPAW